MKLPQIFWVDEIDRAINCWLTALNCSFIEYVRATWALKLFELQNFQKKSLFYFRDVQVHDPK